MPVTAIIKLRARTSGYTTRSFHCLMHAVLLDKISKADPGLGKILHDQKKLMSYSISPVQQVRNKLRENQSCWVRISLLDDTLTDIFYATMEKGLWREPIHLENHEFLLENINILKDEQNDWSGCQSFENLLAESKPLNKITFKIESPMSFKKGDFHYPLPESSLVFSNLARRWNLNSPIALPEQPDCEKLTYAFFNIKTVPYSLRKSGTVLGAVGKVVFFLKCSENEKKYFHTLLRFAFYSGIGVKTTQGMGMCRIVGEE